MTLTLGPIIGVSINGARIWVKGEINAPYCIRYGRPFSPVNVTAFSTDDNGVGVVSLVGLASNTQYQFDILNQIEEVEASGCRFATFPDVSESIDFSFAFFSCHKPAEATSMVMWDRLSGMCHGASKPGDANSLRFMLPIGDQIYADELGAKSKDYLKYKDELDLELHFDSKYNDFWKLRSVRDVFGRCPAFMMWDDHEIRDGWASRKGDLTSLQLMNVYRAAERAFIQHQLLHNPFCPNPQTQKYYSFRFAQAGFIVPDLRGERNFKTKSVMSRAQWKWLRETLFEYSGKCEAVFLVLGVPLFHPVRGLARAIVDALNLVSKDEMEDSWISKQWLQETSKLLKLLFEIKGAPGRHADLYLLSGDAHIATGSEMRFGSNLTIRQFTSSAISNASPGVLKKVSGNIQSNNWKQIIENAPYEGRMPHLVAARNFGVVRVARRNQDKCTVKFELQYEREDAHLTLFDGEQLGNPIVVV